MHARFQGLVQVRKLGGLTLHHVVESLDAQQRAHPRQQFDAVDRLDQEVIRARLDGTDAIGRGGAGDHHNRQHRRPWRGAHASTHLVAVDAGQDQVEQHQVGWLQSDPLERLLTRPCANDGVPLRREHAFQQLCVDRRVVHDQHSRGVRFLPDRHPRPQCRAQSGTCQRPRIADTYLSALETRTHNAYIYPSRRMCRQPMLVPIKQRRERGKGDGS